MKKWRIVRDNYAGYEVQCRRLWFPFWIQVRVNTHRTLEGAKDFLRASKGGVVYYE
jgi:hypothetical protein